MAFISYAQNYEDVMLWRALKDVPQGFYIDVGAQDPDVDSVTRAFYERGWSGINIEPVPKYHELLCRARPRDINLRVAVGVEETEREFFEIPDTGLSTLDPQIAARHLDAGWTASRRRVAQRRLAEIWTECVKGQVHFLKIDAEGSEADILQGAGLSQHRPWIVVVEAVAPLTQVPEHEKWERLLTDAGYAFVYFDGMNRFYLASEKAELKARFAAPPNFFDDFMRAAESKALQDVAALRQGILQPAPPGDLSSRLNRIEIAVQGTASSLQALTQRSGAEQDILFSQVAYLGEHRALTYLRSGHKIFVDTRSVDIGTHLMLGGWWESNYATAFCNLLKPGDVILDIGANHGFYSLIAAPRISPGGHVYAFEPSKSFYDLIMASVSVNGLGDIVSVANLALGDADGDVTLAFDRHWSGGGHIEMGRPHGTKSDMPTGLERETVKCVSLDNYLGGKLDKVDVIKMDIEGAEGLALKGMSKIIDRSPNLKMMMEFCPAMMAGFECDANFVVQFLESRGFMCWEIGVDGRLLPARWQKLMEEPKVIRNVIVSRQGLG
ncbi:MAG TPA: FkbM family methyltransferase [Casimicrobiaceae bacterium]|nr:FkbM family methyltransferase [Casimicrobiaceae bacterium]